jgi:ABC-type uncharacterized transport system fused permease/ATPase subunit
VDMYIKIIKPIIDITYFTYHLSSAGGYIGPVAVVGYMGVAVFLISLVMPNFGKMFSERSEKEGIYRKQHSRIRTHAESIAVYNGDNFEKKIANERFKDVFNHVQYIIGKSYTFGICYDALFKYFPHTIVWIIMAFPSLCLKN